MRSCAAVQLEDPSNILIFLLNIISITSPMCTTNNQLYLHNKKVKIIFSKL